MSVTPIEIQTNFAQQANVDRMRQAEVIQNQGAQTEGDAINRKIVEESKAVIETFEGEADREVKDYDEGKSSGKGGEKNDGAEDRESPGNGSGGQGEEKAVRQMRDPSKGKFVDITL